MFLYVISKPRKPSLPSALQPLSDKNFGPLWAGAILSSMGFWIQNVGQGWQVLQLTNSAFLLGMVVFAATLPNLVFALIGGVIADRMDRRTLLIGAHIIYMLAALSLGIFTSLNTITVWQIMLIALLNGTVGAVGQPAWQAFVGDLAPEGQLRQGIALNSMQFNLSRVIGPAIGGLSVGLLGIAGSYYLNALSYVGVLIPLLLIRPTVKKREIVRDEQSIWQGLREGLQYARRNPMLQVLLALQLVFAFFVFPYLTLLPVFADKIFGIGAAGLGILNSAAGIGAFGGSILLVMLTRRIADGPRVLLFISAIGGVVCVAFSLVPNMNLALPLLALLGVCSVISTTLTNTTLQTMVPEAMRARMLSLWILIAFGLAPVGNLCAGWIAQMIGAPMTLTISGIVCIVGTLLITLVMTMFVPVHARLAQG